MTRIEEVLAGRLLTDPDVAALIGVGVYAYGIPMGESLPCVTYYRMSTEQSAHYGGISTLQRSNFRFDVWAESLATMKDVGDAVLAALNGYKARVDSVNVQGCFLATRAESYEPDTELFHEVVEMAVWYEEGV